jgi:hypothetical protein
MRPSMLPLALNVGATALERAAARPMAIAEPQTIVRLCATPLATTPCFAAGHQGELQKSGVLIFFRVDGEAGSLDGFSPLIYAQFSFPNPCGLLGLPNRDYLPATTVAFSPSSRHTDGLRRLLV